MTDRELLELAAKAARFDGKWGREGYIERYVGFIRKGWRRAWNPLDRNDDAFELMCRLTLAVMIDAESKCVVAVFYGGIKAEEKCATGEEVPPATRRAIVRAAAAIGAQ